MLLLFWLIKILIRYYRKLKVEKKPLLNKTTLSIGVPILAAFLILIGYDRILSIGTTAIVLDAETGKPVEGAVALAQWFRAGGGGMFEGGVEVLDKAVETYSDKEGKIYIRGSWGLHIFSSSPRLTVYKPGYVLWDSRRLCPTDMPRTDFDENHRTVKLLKFDIEAPKWHTKNPIHNGPRQMHNSFFSSCCRDITNEMKFEHIFRENELPQLKKEEEKARLFEKSLELRRPLHARGGNQTWPKNYTGEYTDLDNGIIRDSVSGLEWQQATAAGTYNWGQALDYCDNLDLGGYHDWRLPTIEELKTLADKGFLKQFHLAINTKFFRVTAESPHYWSYWPSSVNPPKIHATLIDFFSGSHSYDNLRDGDYYVRCVRGGQ